MVDNEEIEGSMQWKIDINDIRAYHNQMSCGNGKRSPYKHRYQSNYSTKNRNSPSKQQSLSKKKDDDANNIFIVGEQLTAMFGKGDFEKLRILGQFNKGFMICSLNNDADLFILDQHASDEKFNFEVMSKTTILHCQDLMHPIKVTLSVTDALAVNLHREVFRYNGFKVISATEANPDDPQANPNEFHIKSLPYSKNTVFTVDDFNELVQIINEHLDYSKEDTSTTCFRPGVTDRSKKTEEATLMHKEVLRPKRIYSMLANRACRASFMVGHSLNHKQMRKIINNLATLESPWNCPHGRPTLRFLKKLKAPGTEVKEAPKLDNIVLPSRGRTVRSHILK